MVQTTNNTIDNRSKTLSIQVSLNGLSFCATDTDQQITAIEHDNFGIQLTPEQVLDKIKYLFDNNLKLKGNFETVEVIYQNDLYTLVPKPLFDQNMLKEYLHYTIKVLQNDFITYDELDQHEIVTVYIPYTNINNFFFDTFGSFTYKHASTILVSSLLSREKNSESTSVFAHMNANSFDLIIIEKGKLIMGNTFTYETEEDFLYYLMFATEQVKLNPEEFSLVFLGSVTKESECYKIANTYIRNISFGNFSQTLNVSPEIKPFEPHQHFVLLSHF